MTRAVIWKELREQATVVAALLALGVGLMAALAVLIDPQGQSSGGLSVGALRVTGVLAGVMLALAAGLVVGATLFAGEREAGTHAFLDRLPASRWSVWWRKLLAGLALAALPAAGYFAAARLSGLITGPDANGQAALLFVGVTLYGYAWGAFGSAWMRTALGACAVGLLAAVATAFALYTGYGLISTVLREVPSIPYHRDLYRLVRNEAVPVGALAMALLPLVGSAFLYTAPDRDRSIGGVVRVPTPSGEMRTLRLRWPRLRPTSIGPFQTARRFGWLLVRQHRVTAVWLGLVALLAGVGMLAPKAVLLAAWPPLGLFLGVLVGVTLFADEQGSDAARFWGERRLRVGRLWRAKLAFAAVLLFGLLVVMLLPMVVRGFAEAETNRVPFATAALQTKVFESGIPVIGFFLLGPVYGLAFGQLAALLLRKPIVAATVGLMLGGMAGALWMPSLVGGGVHGWQLWGPPAVVFVTSRLLMWPWATDRLGARPALRRLALGLTAAVAVVAAGIGWRVVEVPAVPQARDDIAFAKSLPSFDETQGGRDVRKAASLFTTALAPVADKNSATFAGNGIQLRLVDEIETLLDSGGYPANRPDLDAFLTKLDDPEWQQALRDSAAKPTGVFIDPTEYTFGTFHNAAAALQTFARMARVDALLGLKAQRDGDPADFAERLRILLAGVNTTRDRGPYAAVYQATNAEAYTLVALDRWLAGLRGRPDLLRAVLATLVAHDAAVTANFRAENAFYAEQTILRNSLDSPSQWLPQELAVGYGLANAEVETEIIAFLWAVPWERDRLERAVGSANASPVKGAGYLAGVPGLWHHAFLINDFRKEVADLRPLALTRVRARVVAVAARLFEAERGRFPKSAAELIPAYLLAVPADPYGTGAMNYRVAVKAEAIHIDPPRLVATFTAPGDPLGNVFADDPEAVAHGVAAAAGAVVFRGAVAPLVNPDGTPTNAPWSPPSATAVTRHESVDLRVAAGQPVVWSVGPDRANGGGLIDINTMYPRTGRLAADLVFPVPLPAPAR